VRVVAPLAGYPIRRHLSATLLGRFPRLWFFAALGLYWHVSASVLWAIASGTIALHVVIWMVKRRRGGTPSARPR